MNLTHVEKQTIKIEVPAYIRKCFQSYGYDSVSLARLYVFFTGVFLEYGMINKLEQFDDLDNEAIENELDKVSPENRVCEGWVRTKLNLLFKNRKREVIGFINYVIKEFSLSKKEDLFGLPEMPTFSKDIDL